MTMTAQEVIKPFQALYPMWRYASTDREIGVWIDSAGRFVPFAYLTITGDWVFMDYDILVNGQFAVRDWKEMGRGNDTTPV